MFEAMCAFAAPAQRLCRGLAASPRDVTGRVREVDLRQGGFYLSFCVPDLSNIPDIPDAELPCQVSQVYHIDTWFSHFA